MEQRPSVDDGGILGHRRRLNRGSVLAGVVGVVIGVLTVTAACSGGSHGGEAPGPKGADEGPAASTPRSNSFRVVAAGFSFEPNRIEAVAGSQITVTLVNAGATEHNITFELPEDEGGWQTLTLPVVPGERGVLSFRAPSRPGRYQYSCRVADHTERGMVGTLEVVEGGQGPPAGGAP